MYLMRIMTDEDAAILTLALAAVPDIEVRRAYDDAVVQRDTRAMALCAAELNKRGLSLSV
jgi:hypothetical protein